MIITLYRQQISCNRTQIDREQSASFCNGSCLCSEFITAPIPEHTRSINLRSQQDIFTYLQNEFHIMIELLSTLSMQELREFSMINELVTSGAALLVLLDDSVFDADLLVSVDYLCMHLLFLMLFFYFV